jgi:hypothetical protein
MGMAMTMGMAMGRMAGDERDCQWSRFCEFSQVLQGSWHPLEGPRACGPYGFREVRCGR